MHTRMRRLRCRRPAADIRRGSYLSQFTHPPPRAAGSGCSSARSEHVIHRGASALTRLLSARDAFGRRGGRWTLARTAPAGLERAGPPPAAGVIAAAARWMTSEATRGRQMAALVTGRPTSRPTDRPTEPRRRPISGPASTGQSGELGLHAPMTFSMAPAQKCRCS